MTFLKNSVFVILQPKGVPLIFLKIIKNRKKNQRGVFRGEVTDIIRSLQNKIMEENLSSHILIHSSSFSMLFFFATCKTRSMYFLVTLKVS